MTTAAPDRALAGRAAEGGTRTAVAAAAIVGALGSAAYIASFAVAADLTVREAARHPLVITANLLVAVAFMALAVTVRGLAGPTGLPRWALTVTAAGCAAVGAVAWAQATVMPYAAGLLSDAQVEQGGAFLTLLWLPKMALCAVGLVGLAVAGRRLPSAPRGLSVLLAVAGVASLLPPYPPGALLTGLALAWIARTVRA